MIQSSMGSGHKSSGNLFPIAGIGASAGGLNSLECFLAALPKEFGFAIVFIQHLSPKHTSLMPDLLRSMRPDLDIVELSDALKVLPGRLYLCPPAKDVRIQKGILRVSPRSDEHVHLSIDEFLVSLAEDAAERAIAVIFSGAGTDGARGVQAVRTAGGTVFVQDPATAEFPAMPLAAINTGQVDGVLSPPDIAREILKLHGSGMIAVAPDDLVAPVQFEALCRLIYEKTGHRFNHYKKNVVARRVRRRMYLHGLSSVSDYLEMIVHKDSEAFMLASDLMIGVTSFFRDRLAWKALHIEVIRKLVADNEDSSIRVWTPACATGEEAYSIAMMLQHELDLAGRKKELQVFATDVNDRALEKAREGAYPGSIIADVPPDFMRKFFNYSQDGLSVTISKEIRQLVLFAKQDLVADPPFSRLDLIICRNLLIYLEADAQQKCISLFHYALKNGGYLFLGNAESPGRNSTLFKPLAHKKCRVYRKIESQPSPRLPLAAPFAAERRPSPRSCLPMAVEHRQTVTQFIQEALLEEYAPAAVAIDQNYYIVYHNGPTNRYLRQPRGVPTQNLLELLPENLRSRIRGGLYRAAHEARAVSIRTGIQGDDGRKRQVTIRVSKVKDDLFMIMFHEKGGLFEEAGAVPLETAAVEETAVLQLESELSATREELQSHIEQLRSLNEELQSSNEELQAANEELETSREELQSLNEELIIVNSQLQAKIEEQEETNNDLNNFLASTNIPTIFLDQRLMVKRFTPAMTKLIKLIPADVGRPIIDMSQEFLGPDLIADAESVLENLAPVKKEITINGTWYVRAMLPYRTSDSRIEGVVITYADVTNLKQAEERTRHLASFPQLNPNPVVEVDSSGRVTFSNPATQRILESLGMDQGDYSAFLPADLEGILRELESKQESTLYREKTIKDRVFGADIYLVPQFDVVRIYARDITERKRIEEALSEREAEYRSLFENMINGFAYHKIIVDGQGKPVDYVFLEMNDAFEKLTGLKRTDIIGKSVREALPGIETDPADWIGTYGRVALTGSEARFEQYAGPLDKWYSVTAYSPFKDHFVTIFEDITERKRAEDELLQNRLDLSRAQAVGSIGSWRLDVRKNELTWSDENHRIFGIPKGTAMSYETFLGIVHPDDREYVDRKWKAGLAGEPYDIEHRIDADGRVKWVREKAYLEFGEDGSLLGGFGITQDITERKQAEEELAEAMQRLRAHIDNSPLAVIEFDSRFRVTGWSKEAERLFGWTAAEIVGRSVPEMRWVHDEEVELVSQQAAGFLSGKCSRSLNVNRNYRKDGSVVLCEWYNSAIYDAQGKLVSVLSQVLDITEHKRVEEALKHANLRLAEVNEELESFVYSASHDLRAPLRAISGFAKIMADRYADQVDEKGKDYLARILNGTAKMSRLIDDLLQLSRISRQEIGRREVNMSTMASSIIAELRETHTGGSVEVDIEEHLTAYADPRLIEVALSNLLGNAWKFTSKTENARIEFGAVRQEGKIVYYVRDNGAGFDPKYAERMFWPFHRLHSGTEFEGTGIGLAIVERVIRRHGGKVWAEGETGRGATIYFTLT